MAVENFDKVRKFTVDDPPDAVNGARSDFFMVSQARGVILPAWGTRDRERWLRAYYRHEYNWLGQSAISALVKKVKATPWEIAGKRGVNHFQDVLREAEFGAGWGEFISKLIVDYLRQDIGGFIEVIGPGNPMRPMTAAAVGLRVLDALRCVPTGDPEYPVRYYSQADNEIHLMHYTRVRQMVDMVDSDSYRPGTGLCGLSRAISIVQAQISMNRFIESRLDDKPSPGIVAINGMPRQQWEQALAEYRKQQSADETPEWGRQMFVYSNGPDQKVEVTQTTFSQAPEGWSYADYNSIHVNAWAAALGMDVQEVWQLGGGSLGSGAQSEILHQKSEARGFGDILTTLERLLNMVLPDNLEFTFKRHDPHGSKQEAETASMWAGFVAGVGGALTDDEKRVLLASKVEAFKDAVTDADGSIVRLNDLQDPPPSEQTANLVLDDQNPAQNGAGNDPDAQTVDDQKARFDVRSTTAYLKSIAGEPLERFLSQMEINERAKAIQATRLDFEDGLEDLISDARAKDITRNAFSRRLRALIGTAARKAYIDGLNDGGVQTDVLDDAEQLRFVQMLGEQSGYVTDFARSLYDTGISDAQAAQRPAMWFNKTIEPFYDEGRYSADRNGMYEFGGPSGTESCTTCKRLKGQRHRLKWWVDKRLRPRVDTDNYVCGGWNCQHLLVKTTDGSRGRG